MGWFRRSPKPELVGYSKVDIRIEGTPEEVQRAAESAAQQLLTLSRRPDKIHDHYGPEEVAGPGDV